MWCMRRTSIYLTAAQTEFLKVRAAAAGTTRSAVTRGIVDDAAAQPGTLNAETPRALDTLTDGG